MTHIVYDNVISEGLSVGVQSFKNREFMACRTCKCEDQMSRMAQNRLQRSVDVTRHGARYFAAVMEPISGKVVVICLNFCSV